ncbi:MAG TPA: site-2 protease family protein [Vicinamibacterales bacterium]
MYEPDAPPAAVPVRQGARLWVHVLLFLLTALTTTFVGGAHALGFASDFGTRPEQDITATRLLTTGLSFSIPFLGFLLAHEFGHYLAARAHGLRPSLPYFIPAPLPLTGTMGAVIFFRGRFPNRRVLFDFAAAGPLAGFAVAAPVLFLGLTWSRVVAVPENMEGFYLGEPLLFQWMANALFGDVAEGYSINLHPTALAGWLGLLFTLMNLIPAGQLDGGHIAYAWLGRPARWVTLLSFVAIGGLIVVGRAYSWAGWLVVLLVLLWLFGWDHPPALDDVSPLDPIRVALVIAVIGIFVVCFMPVPISPIEFMGS